jgi:hypothetical protein
MLPFTKHNLPALIHIALSEAGIDESHSGNIALELVRHRAVEFRETARTSMELIVVAARSRQATRTAGGHLNVFAFAGVVLAVMAVHPSLPSAAAVFLSLLSACSVSLSPEQAAFILATKSTCDSRTVPTAKAIASAMADQVGSSPVTPKKVIEVAEQLQRLGVPISIGDPPNHVIRHSEWVLIVPGA